MYIVGFNGPPQSGKDTLAAMLADKMDHEGVTLPVKMESLSFPLRKIAYAMTDTVGPRYGLNYESFKLCVFSQFGGVTGRKLMIDISEMFLKPVYGLEIMAKLLLERNAGFGGVLLIRDCGFQCEVGPLESAVGPENVYMVSVFREDHSFADDSREWVKVSSWNQHIHNDQDLDHLKTEADRIYGRLVNQCGWKL